jgi:hypothetical protein
MQRVVQALTRLLDLYAGAVLFSAATLAEDDSLGLDPYKILDGFFLVYRGDAHGRLLMRLAIPVALFDLARLGMGRLAAEPALIESLPLAVVPPGLTIDSSYKSGY